MRRRSEQVLIGILIKMVSIDLNMKSDKRLMNEVRVPIILMGTFVILSFISRTFRKR